MLTLFDDESYVKVDEALPKYSGQVIYETRGRAREYRELACNLYTGCPHRCAYCYVPEAIQKDRQQFYTVSYPRKDILSKLEKDAREYGRRGEKRQILFCFACAPYQPLDDQYQITRKAIEICHRWGLGVNVLTKGGKRSLRDIDLYTSKDSYACSLTTLDGESWRKWEPGSAIPTERISVLAEFYNRGIDTWVSLEPVINPEWTLQLLEDAAPYTNEFKVGTLNHHSAGKNTDWHKFAHDVTAALDKSGRRYYIKHDLRKYL